MINYVVDMNGWELVEAVGKFCRALLLKNYIIQLEIWKAKSEKITLPLYKDAVLHFI